MSNPALLATAADSVIRARPAALAPGDRLGSYALLDRLGRGGMGEVWRAEHVEIKSQVAIKLVLDDSGDPGAAARFLQEAKATARIRHPGIVAVTDYGLAPDRGAYLVMELLDGETLAQRLARGTLPLAATITLAIQICEALVAAHATGVIHRDLKPANIFLVRDHAVTAGVRAKLLDFGVAKDLGANALTVTGNLVGTPLYMAPEQCTSSKGPVDARADLYALGVVLYEMLTATTPFTGPSFGDLIVQHLEARPAAPSAVRPGLPRAVDDLVMQLLAKAREDRPATARDVVRMLSTITVDRAPDSIAPTIAHTPAPLPTARLARRRKHWPLLAGGLLVAAASTVVVVVRGEPSRPAIDLSAIDAALRADPPDLPTAFATAQSACDRESPEGCAHLATMYERGTGVRADTARARTLAEAACAARIAIGCELEGDLLAKGIGGKQDIAQARARWTTACELGGAHGCNQVAWALRFGIGTARDRDAARGFTTRARALAEPRCASGDGASCMVMSALEADDLPRSASHALRACEAGSFEACGPAGEAYYVGSGVPKDGARAQKLLRRGCDGGSLEACQSLAFIVVEGDDPAAGVAIARHTCEERDDRGCLALATMYSLGVGVVQDGKLAESFADRACAAGEPEGCTLAGRLVAIGVVRDPVQVREAFDRACRSGDGSGCVGLGELAIKRGDYAEAFRTLELGCELTGSTEGCDALASLYFEGKGVVRDPDKGRKLLEEGCELRVALTCNALGKRLATGTGLPANPAEALRKFELGCEIGFPEPCAHAAALLSDRSSGLRPDPARAASFRKRACLLGEKYCEKSRESVPSARGE